MTKRIGDGRVSIAEWYPVPRSNRTEEPKTDRKPLELQPILTHPPPDSADTGLREGDREEEGEEENEDHCSSEDGRG